MRTSPLNATSSLFRPTLPSSWCKQIPSSFPVSSGIPSIFWMACCASLDALIRLRAPLGPDALKSIAKGYPDDAAILMLQHPYENQETLAWFRTEFPSGAGWVATSNELTALRSRGFAAALLRETTITHRFVVATHNREACCTGMVGSLLGGLLTLKVPSGFPPIYFYRLTGKPLAGDELLADGPAPIYMRRALLQPGADGAMPRRARRVLLAVLKD